MPRFTFLGTGTSTGIPMLACPCETCTSDDPRDRRLRSSALVASEAGRIVIDTTPEFRLQCLAHEVDSLDAVFLTHDHADHIAGLDDVRAFTIRTKRPLPVYCHARTAALLRERFAYIFDPPNPEVTVPLVDLRVIDRDPVEVAGLRVEPLPVFHGPEEILAYRIGSLAYVTDVNRIPDETWLRLEGLEVLILDAVRHHPHPTHYSLPEALDVIQRLRPRQAWLTHVNHNILHARDSALLPEGVGFAVDGQAFDFG
jgi:phosphoribosyl 1,2-cyclic phosphate phosphodiesterase